MGGGMEVEGFLSKISAMNIHIANKDNLTYANR